MKDLPFTNIDAVFASVDAFAGAAEEFVLPISDLLQDPIGINMARVTDRVLARGWLPAGFDQQDGYRLYHYEALT